MRKTARARAVVRREHDRLRLKRAKKRQAKRSDKTNPPFLGDQAFTLLVNDYEFDTVLDVGCGDGAQARAFRAKGKRVTTISLEPYGDFAPDFVGDLMDFESTEQFDVVWCSHTLEHQRNVGQFVEQLARFVRPGGVLAITVPTARRTIVGGHLTVWNTGLLLYNLVVAGIDCSEARTKEYGYNVSVIVRVRPTVLPPLRQDKGDIERLASLFPIPVAQGFDGRIAEIAWSSRARHVAAPLTEAGFRALPAPHHTDLAMLAGIARSLRAPGHILEFGVFEGRSIRALARELPDRVIHGFDSFDGLPLPWRRSATSTYPAGHFRVAALPEVPHNVKLWPGLFSDTLEPWLHTHPGPAALVHLDCDLYESTAAVLTKLNPRIVAGTILVFDELCDWTNSKKYPEWREGEWRALIEWANTFHRSVRLLSRGPQFSGAIEVIA